MSYDRGRGRGRGDGGFSGGRGGGPAGRGYDGGGGFRGDRGGRGGGPPGGGRGRGEPARLYGGGNVSPPNAEVTKLEDAMVKGEMSSMMTALTIDGGKFQLPKRPGYGTKGKPIILHTNYLELKGINPETTLYRYSMAFQPDDDSLSKPKKKRIVQLLLSTPPYQGLPIASDWAQLLVSPTKVPIEGTRSATKIEWYPSDGTPLPAAAPEEPERIQKARKKNTFTVLVEDIGTVSVGQLLNDLAQPGTTYPLKLETIQALNVLMAHGPSSAVNIAVAGGNKFYPFGNHPQFEQANLGGGLNALRGYFSSVRTSVNRILVNINVATGAFYKSGPLIEVMTDWTGGSPPQNQFQQAQLARFVRKLRFETNYLPDKDKDGKVKKDGKGKPLTKRKVHTLIDLSAHGQNAENVKFQIEEADGKTKDVTVAAYFKSKYNITLRSPRAPVVNYGSLIDPKWIPSELCTVLPGQLAKRMLSGQQTSEMIRFAARRPHENAESIMGNGLKVTKIMPVADGLNTSLSRFGIKVNPSLISVQGRILPAPALQYRGKAAPPPLNGAWNLDTRQLGQAPFLVTRQLGAWTTLVINSGNRDTLPGGKEGAVALLNSFKRTLDAYGLKAGPVTGTLFVNVEPGLLATRKVGAIQQQIELTLRKAPKPNFLFIVLPSDNAVLYDSIKFLLDVKFGIPNICSIGSKLSKEKGQIQYFANVALKFNQKLGGVNHTVALKELAPLDAQTIVFGIDVTHPSPGSNEDAPSIAGVVASVDDKFSQYPASLRTQKGRQEMVGDLQEMVEERLKLWQKKNQQRLPNKVIVYRDGVSEGQYSIVLRDEEPAFQRAFDKLYGAKPKHPKISLMMVGKRHSTRFYPTKQEDSDGRTGNPKPGTIVDRGVTGEKLFDFYLQAHQVLQGTGKPAHYVVLKDDNKLGADQLQSLTHHLCYTFARATRSVSLCPPAYYADLLCERGRCYLQGVLKGDGSVKFDKVSSWQRDVNKNLAETMFYL